MTNRAIVHLKPGWLPLNAMNKRTLHSLTALGAVLLSVSAQAQTKVSVTTSTNAVPSPVSSPTVQPDTLQPNRAGMTMPQGDDRDTRQNRKQRRKNRDKSSAAPATNTTDYRPNAVGNGTATNNSNNTNYNSQNAVAPATGVGAVPPAAATGAGSNQTGAGTTNGTVSAGSTMGTPTQAGSTAVTKAPTPGPAANPDRSTNAANRSKTLTVGDFVAGSPNYTTLQNALQTATLDKTLKGTGPFTVFAPSNEAFKKLPTQTQTVLLEGRNLDALKALLSYHVVAGEIDAAELTRRIKAGNGKAVLPTVSGSTLILQSGPGGRLSLTDEEGNTVAVDPSESYQANGVVYGISNVLLPKGGAASFR